MTLPWSHPDADPIADIQEMMAFHAANDDFRPNTLVMSWRVYKRLMRRQLTKRQYRRWRGRHKAALRAWINAGRPE